MSPVKVARRPVREAPKEEELLVPAILTSTIASAVEYDPNESNTFVAHLITNCMECEPAGNNELPEEDRDWL